MIEIVRPAMYTIVVDQGRYGQCAIGVPPSAALDRFASAASNWLTGNDASSPVLEVIGSGLVLRFDVDTACAITGAKVKAFLDGREVEPWTTFRVSKGGTLNVAEVLEGFRYYVSFSGMMAIDKVMGSYTTNLECGFGGYRGRALAAGDRIELTEIDFAGIRIVPQKYIPGMHPPHTLRVVEGPEAHYFSEDSLKVMFQKHFHNSYSVSNMSNRAGIRLVGEPLIFREGMEKSIISEGVMPGTIQIPGDGQPIIILYERTVGGYTRVAIVVRADHDLLSHLKPSDDVRFEMISVEEAARLWITQMEKLSHVNAL
jgi:antagonist of KipI